MRLLNAFVLICNILLAILKELLNHHSRLLCDFQSFFMANLLEMKRKMKLSELR